VKLSVLFVCLNQKQEVMQHRKKTTVDKGDHHLLNGTKTGLQMTASTYLVIAQTDIEKRHKGINAS
jgi:alkylation response protein AidB-like acyl-CoA dehydrogenase